MKLFLVNAIAIILLAGCSANYQVTSPDEIFDATDGTSNHADDPNSNL